MKTASSIRYGGMLVDSDECDYESFKHLALLCPICKRSVFLVKEKVRPATSRKNKDGSVSAVKATEISSYFAHHPETDKKIVSDCELRSSQLTNSQKILAASIARDQRQKKLKAHIWKIIQSSPRASSIEDNAEIVRMLWQRTSIYNSRRAEFALQEIINYCLKWIVQAPEEVLLKLVDKTTEVLSVCFTKASLIHVGATEVCCLEDLEYYKTWSSHLDRLMHAKICLEAIDFLRTRKQKDLMELMILSSIFIIIREDVLIGNKSVEIESDYPVFSALLVKSLRKFTGTEEDELLEIKSLVLKNFVDTVVSVPWASQFELLERKQANKRTLVSVE